MTEYTSKWNLGVSSSLSGSLTGFDPGQNTGPCSDSPSEREGLQQEFFLVSFLQRYFSGCAEGVPIFLFSTKNMTFFPFVVFFFQAYSIVIQFVWVFLFVLQSIFHYYYKIMTIIPYAIQYSCFLSILYIVIYIYLSYNPNLSFSPSLSPLVTINLFPISVNLFLFCIYIHYF